MINSADTLKHRDVSEDTIEIFKNLYAKGHSPASALNTHKLDMQHEKDYVYEAADRANCPDIQFCHSAAGGLPLGYLIVTSESRDCITQALRLYLEILPKDGFFGRSSSGPLVFLSDDSEAERQSLHELLSAVKKMTFAGSVIALEKAYPEVQANDIASLYPNYLAHCKKLYDRRQAWAVCYRHDLLVRGNNTNNYAEAAMRILKDQIFERVRAYNIAQLLDFLVTRLPSYYERRLIDLANGRMDVTVSKRFLPGASSIPKYDIIKIDAHNYEVRSQSKQDIVYHVDTSIWTCTCMAGMNGAPCKHQYAVVKNFGESSLNFIPLRDPHQREHLLFIATEKRMCVQVYTTAHCWNGNRCESRVHGQRCSRTHLVGFKPVDLFPVSARDWHWVGLALLLLQLECSLRSLFAWANKVP
ncbi:hypothetical protein O3P69_012136 [Scylla paramamosain]|uniref:SWIM-type domain-containing protein n=1 Tax=Scylla paramamosain TaxID=85552 RepID=A0AAW0TEZ2_SCYPA